MNPTRLDGQPVRARLLGADGVPDGEWTLYDDDRPEAVVQVGTLTVNHVAALDYTQFIVNGLPVEPESITPLATASLRAVS